MITNRPFSPGKMTKVPYTYAATPMDIETSSAVVRRREEGEAKARKTAT